MVDTTYQTQFVREAPEIEAYKLGMLQEAQNLYNQGVALPATEAAGLSGTELQAIDFAKQGIGSFEPYIQAASQGLTQGMDLTQRGAPVLGQGVGGILGSAQMYDPTMAEDYFNPYYQEVTRNALAEMDRQAAITRPQEAAQAVAQGAFGGTREGVQRAEFDSRVQDMKNQRIMQDYANNYAQAQQAAMAGFESQQARQLAGGQALGQSAAQFANLGSEMGRLGTQYGALGQATQQLGAADTGLLAGLGGLERQIEQSQLDAIRATQLQDAMTPYQQLGFVSDIYRGAPSTSMALTAQTAPSASPLQSAVGLGVGALATAAGAKNAGLF